MSILIINTGGTIGMVEGPNGFQPAPNILGDLIHSSQEFTHVDTPDYDLIHLDPVVDSSNITIEHWNRLIELLAQHRDHYQGFVILHGTDTMAYSASVLSFCLQGFLKPIIFTGSQIPLSQLRNDAKDNFLNALLMAAKPELQEVCVYFSRKLYRGNRVFKYSADEYAAFTSPNYPVLASVGIDITLSEHCLLKKQPSYAKHLLKDQQVATVKLYPGFDVALLDNLMTNNTKALIIEAFGKGNLPSDNHALIKKLSDIASHNCPVILRSQCPDSSLDLHSYATARALSSEKICNSFDMTFEACLAKTYYLLSQGKSGAAFKQAFETPLVGECCG